jgi:hypothetical protein
MVSPTTLGGLTLVVWIISVIGGVMSFRSLEDETTDHETVVKRARLHAAIALLTGLLIILWFLRTLGLILT